MGDIVERLREQPTMSSFANIGDMVGRLNHEREEAANEIERLRFFIKACIFDLTDKRSSVKDHHRVPLVIHRLKCVLGEKE